VQALTRSADKIDKYGGHEMAAGLTIQEKNLDLFADNFVKRLGSFCRMKIFSRCCGSITRSVSRSWTSTFSAGTKCFNRLAMAIRSHFFCAGS